MSSRGSSRSGASRVSVPKYRTKSNRSEVDEMLFGNTKAEKVRQEKSKKPLSENEVIHFSTGVPLPKSMGAKTKKNKPETVRVVTKDLIRDVVVPQENRSNQVTLDKHTFLQLQRQAFEDFNDEQAYYDEKRAERERIQAEMAARKSNMKKHDDIRNSQPKPANDLDIESQTMADEMLRRSQAQRLEENDEIKHLNELILEAKCHAIRDAQLAEKEQTIKDLQVENDRLDAMMEIDRVEAIKHREIIEKERKIQQQRGAKQIMEQIEANKITRMWESERKEQEAKLLVDNQIKLQMQSLAEIEQKKKQQKELQKEIDHINMQHQEQKAIRAEQEKLANIRVVQYQEEKAKREAESEEAQKEIRRQKELEIAKLRAAQERASDLQAERDVLRAKRHEEATEREYRRKAREEAAKKSAIEDEMRLAREEQIQAKRHLMAVQAARERAEFDKSLLEQQKEVAKMATKEAFRQEAKVVYAEDIRTQINEREAAKIDDRKQFFEDTLVMDKDLEEKNRQIEEVKLNKLRGLKASGVPEKYVLEVARRIGMTSLE